MEMAPGIPEHPNGPGEEKTEKEEEKNHFVQEKLKNKETERSEE